MFLEFILKIPSSLPSELCRDWRRKEEEMGQVMTRVQETFSFHFSFSIIHVSGMKESIWVAGLGLDGLHSYIQHMLLNVVSWWTPVTAKLRDARRMG